MSRDIQGRYDALAGAGMKTEQISSEKVGFMQSRATTIILHKFLLATRLVSNVFGIPRRTGFRNRQIRECTPEETGLYEFFTLKMQSYCCFLWVVIVIPCHHVG